MSINPDAIDESADDIRIAGDWQDDDPGYVEDLYAQHPQPPAANELPRDNAVIPHVAKPQRTRLIVLTESRRGPISIPILLLPEDPNRIELSVQAGATLLISPERDSLSDISSWAMVRFSYLITGSGAQYVFPGYTGPVWAATAPGDANNFDWQYSVSAITKD